MNVTRVGNQDNRTNFNGWIWYRKSGSKFETGNVQLDMALLEGISDRISSANLAKKRIVDFNQGKRSLHIDDKTTIWYDEEGGLGIINHSPEPLQPDSWEDNINKNTDGDFQIKFREVKVKLARAIDGILGW